MRFLTVGEIRHIGVLLELFWRCPDTRADRKEDQTLRSFFFELARVRGAAIGTVGAPNNLR
jgi:hypothetical protein